MPDESRRHGRLLMLAAALLNAAASANYSALTVTLAAIAADLGAGTTEETWLPDAFLVAVVCVTPLTPRLIAGVGAHRLIRLAAWGTIAASLATSASQSFGLLVVLMFVQGLFAAPLPPVTHSLITARVPFAQQGRGMAAWTAGTMGGFLVGSVVGGAVVEHIGWRWIPLIGIPFALAGLVAARATLAGDGDAAGDATPERRTDWLGAALLGTALLCAAVALDLVREMNPEYRTTIRMLAGVSLASAIGFAANYRRIDKPIIDLIAARDRPLAIASTLNFVITATSTGIFMTVMLGAVAGIGAEEMGVLAATRGVALLAGVAAAPVLLGRAERFALTTSVGLAFICAGKLGMLGWDADTGFLQVAVPGALTSIGIGMFSTALAVMAVATIAQRHREAASSLFVFSGVFGSAIGVALLGAFRVWRQAALTAAGTPAPELASFRQLFAMNLIIALALLPLPMVAARRRTGNHSGANHDEDP